MCIKNFNFQENENPLYYLEKNRQNEKTRKKLLEKFIKSNKNSTDQSSAKSETSSEHDGLESTENDKKLSKKHTKKEQSCRYVTEEERAQLLLVSYLKGKFFLIFR